MRRLERASSFDSTHAFSLLIFHKHMISMEFNRLS